MSAGAGNRGVAGQEQKRIFGMAAAPKEAAGPYEEGPGQANSGQVRSDPLTCWTTVHYYLSCTPRRISTDG
jgi:hypothetical protein